MTAKELLQPRFEIIADYPMQSGQIGHILNRSRTFFHYATRNIDEELLAPESVILKYPHLFRKLNWWEKREEKDMPKKIKSLQYGDIIPIIGWDMETMFGYTSLEDKWGRRGYGLETFTPEYGYIPVD